MFRTTLAFLLAFSALSSALAVDRSGDIQKLRKYIDLDQSYREPARQTARQLIQDLEGTASTLSRAEYFLAVARVVALTDNGHSNISGARAFGSLPIRLFWFSDGPWVIRAHADHAEMLGGRLKAIDGVPLAEAERRMKVYHGGTLEYFRAYYAPGYLISPELLHAEGIARSPERLTLTLEWPEGRQRSFELETDANSSSHARARPWRTLNPKPLEGENGMWRSAMDSDATLPRYLSEPDVDYRYQSIGEGIAYLQLRNNYASDGQSIKKYLRTLGRTIQKDPPRHLILDMRQNPGGDLSRSAAFMVDLPEWLGPEGRIYVLTGQATFSAGIYSSFFSKAIAPQQTVIIGEHVGDRTRFWAETDKPFVLPDSGYRVHYSLEMHDIGDGCHDEAICHMSKYRDEWNIAVGSLAPDEPVATHFADYLARHDPPLTRALKLASGH